MKVEDIVKSVRLCIDEEASNPSSLAGADGDDITKMDSIIKDKIGDALRWVCTNAPSELLSSTSAASASGSVDLIYEETNPSRSDNVITPAKTMLKVVRVKGSKWHRAILGDSMIKEDSDEYLQLKDSYGATATDDRPQAALINTKQRKVEVWPYDGNTFTLTYVKALEDSDISALATGTTIVNLPVLVETSLVYYLAYLLLSAYGDGRSNRMLEIAIQNLGISDKR